MSSSEMAVAQIAHSDGALVIAQHQQALDLVRQNALLAVAKHGLNEREHLVRVFSCMYVFFVFYQTEGAVRNAKLSATF